MPVPQIEALESPPELPAPVTSALIDGSITFNRNLPAQAERAITLPTPAGESPPFYLIEHEGMPYWYVNFHGVDFMTSTANVEVGFTRTWYSLYRLGVTQVISGAAAGSIHPEMRAGDAVIVDDFLDFSTHRPRSMLTEIWEQLPWIGASYVPAMCPVLTAALRAKTKARYDLGQVFESATLAQFEGHRFESPAEIRRARHAGADVVHHHQASEAIYAREMGIHYGAFNYVSNIAAGLADDSWEESWIEAERSAQITAACSEIMIEVVAEAAAHGTDCMVCPVPKEQPVQIDPDKVKPKPVFR